MTKNEGKKTFNFRMRPASIEKVQVLDTLTFKLAWASCTLIRQFPHGVRRVIAYVSNSNSHCVQLCVVTAANEHFWYSSIYVANFARFVDCLGNDT